MRVPESWLRAFASPPWSSEQIADRLTMAGLEVEEVDTAAPPFSGVVVSRVLEVAPHPDADKLSVCKVDVGDGQPRTIVCGAPNVAAGLLVPCALPGAELPGGHRIGSATMRGVRSEGMLCSARELGMSEDHSGLLVLDESAGAPGTNIRQALSLDDTVFTLKLTPNLAHCMSVFGVAREVCALAGVALAHPVFEAVPVTLDDRLPVYIAAPDLCGRFSGRIVRGVNPHAPTPQWMRDRLERAGQRSISALVDVSNYVMLELGRPTHVFDLDRIHGGLDVRWAREGETLKLLNGQTVTLAPDVGVIADEREVESLAGIMGGDATAVSDDTRNVYIEAAFWWPEAVAGRSRRYNFATDAGARFERGVDPSTTVEHVEYLTRLLIDICGGQAGPIDDHVTGLPANEPVTMRTARARKLIGVDLDDATLADTLTRLGLQPALADGQITVKPPPWRFDLQIEEDLVEEAVRVWGYERLPQRPPRAPSILMPQPETERPMLRFKRTVASRDFQEVINYSFVDARLDTRMRAPTSHANAQGTAPDSGATARDGASQPRTILLRNPIAAHFDAMRTSLWGGLIENLRANVNRKATRVRLFEAGRVFMADPAAPGGPRQVAGVAQPLRLGLLAYGPAEEEHWSAAARRVDFFDLKGDLQAIAGSSLQVVSAAHPALHPGRSGRVQLAGVDIGWIGELHPELQQVFELPSAPILAELELDPVLQQPLPQAGELSRFPPVIRDLALIVDITIPAGKVLAEIQAAVAQEPAAAVVQQVRLFDEYRGKGLENKEKSLAFRLWMQDTGRTLSEAEAASAVQGIVDRLAQRIDARLRA